MLGNKFEETLCGQATKVQHLASRQRYSYTVTFSGGSCNWAAGSGLTTRGIRQRRRGEKDVAEDQGACV